MSGDLAPTDPSSETPSWEPDATLPGSWESRGRIARYRVLGLAGIGGMGVVYRAEDTLLKRTVALKFLPPLLTPNPRAKARLLNEARAASALDHPNICTIHEIGETTEGQLYLVMACYDGETLKSRLDRGPLSTAEALNVVRQVALGLAQAHRRGIVHRDVKPANLMITADGIVKIIDFGIAKLPEPARAGPLLGTPAYMSPEQARGEEVAAPSDVWSLGAVFHELLTGRPPQPGQREEAMPPISPKVAGVLSRMLAAEPADRYPDASALLLDLAALERGPARPQRARSQGTSWLLAALVLALAAAFGSSTLRPGGRLAATGRPPLRATFTRLTDSPGRKWFPSLSPDGTLFLYAQRAGGRTHLFLQRVGGRQALDLLPDSVEDDTQPAFSPDGQQIAFRSERDGGGLFLMGATGESVRRITDVGFNPAWSPDGREIVFATEGITQPQIRRQRSEIFRVQVATGVQRLLCRCDAVQPSWSPHGLRIAYWGISSAGERFLWTVPAAGGEPQQVTHDASVDWDPVWSPDGRYLYFTSDRSGVINLWRVAIEERSGRVLGEPEPVPTPARASMSLSISRDGKRIAYASDDSRTILEKVDLDPVTGIAGKSATAIAQISQMAPTLDTSRDGRWLLFQTLVPHESLSVLGIDGSAPRQLTDDRFKNRQPRWSPDGRRIAFYSNRAGKYEIWTLHADGSHLEPVASLPDLPAYHPIWSPDGTRIACDVDVNEALLDLTRPRAERRPRFLPSPGRGLGFSASSWSADGRWLAGVLHRLGGPQVPGIHLFDLASQSYIQVCDRGSGPTWLSDSRRLLYWDRGNVFLLDTRSRKSHQILAPPANSEYDDLSLSPYDRTLYLARSADEGDIWLLTLT